MKNLDNVKWLVISEPEWSSLDTITVNVNANNSATEMTFQRNLLVVIRGILQ